MSPETREKAINLIKNNLTVDSINEIVTILMLEKCILLTTKDNGKSKIGDSEQDKPV